MNLELVTRLNVLYQGNVISQDVLDTMSNVIERMEERWNIVLTEENGARFVTHLAMALMRVARGESVPSMDAASYAEFQACESFTAAREIMDDVIEFAELAFPLSEREYLDMNICLILEGE